MIAPEEARALAAAVGRRVLLVHESGVGRNTVAVEMHQASPTSSEVSFDLRLTEYGLEGSCERSAPADSFWSTSGWGDTKAARSDGRDVSVADREAITAR